jgi:hypothetical protein
LGNRLVLGKELNGPHYACDPSRMHRSVAQRGIPQGDPAGARHHRPVFNIRHNSLKMPSLHV